MSQTTSDATRSVSDGPSPADAAISPQDFWAEDPAAPALGCIRRNLASLEEAARDLRVLLGLCLDRQSAVGRTPAAAAALDDASTALSGMVGAATRAGAALDRVLRPSW